MPSRGPRRVWASGSRGGVPLSRRGSLAAVAAAAALLVFIPSFSHGWVDLDDLFFLVERTEWRGLGWRVWRWAFTSGVGSVYQPLAWLSYGLDFVLWGLDARGYHIQSALWHALSAGLVACLVRELLRIATEAGAEDPPWVLDAAALFGALVFAVHPLRVESVAWASERRDVICCAFFVACLLEYTRARRPGRPARSLVLATALFVLALLAKGMALTMPLALLALDYYPLRRFGPRGEGLGRALREKIPFFVLSGVFALIGLAVQSRVRWSWVQHDLFSRLAQAFYSLAFYVRKTFWPSGLLPMYELRVPLDFREPRFFLSSVAVVLTACLCWRWRHRRPWAAAASAFYSILLAPVCGFFQFGPQLVADRYSYLPCLPWAVLAAAALRWALARRPAAGVAAAAVVVLGLAAAAIKQQAHWTGTETLWARVAAGDPDSGIANLALGVGCVREGRLDQAEAHFMRVFKAFPRCVSDQDRLAELIRRGDSSAEERLLRIRVEENPACRKSRGNMGALLAQRGRLREAASVLSVVVAIDRQDHGALRNLARVEAQLRGRTQPR